MNTLTTTLFTRLLIMRATVGDWLTDLPQRGERGSASTDFALWAAAVVAIAAIVIFAITAFVQTQVAKLQ